MYVCIHIYIHMHIYVYNVCVPYFRKPAFEINLKIEALFQCHPPSAFSCASCGLLGLIHAMQSVRQLCSVCLSPILLSSIYPIHQSECP